MNEFHYGTWFNHNLCPVVDSPATNQSLFVVNKFNSMVLRGRAWLWMMTVCPSPQKDHTKAFDGDWQGTSKPASNRGYCLTACDKCSNMIGLYDLDKAGKHWLPKSCHTPAGSAYSYAWKHNTMNAYLESELVWTVHIFVSQRRFKNLMLESGYCTKSNSF